MPLPFLETWSPAESLRAPRGGRCDIAPFVIPLIIAGVGAATSIGTQIAANSQTKNGPQIRGLEAAQRAGRLTPADQAQVDIGVAQEETRLAQARARNDANAAMMGATSGRDMAALRAADQLATQASVATAADRARAAFAGEAQELEDRKQIRRERTMATVKQLALVGGQVASTIGKYSGNFAKGKNQQDVDFAKSLGDATPEQAAQLQKAYSMWADPESATYNPKAWAAFQEAYDAETVAPPPPVE